MHPPKVGQTSLRWRPIEMIHAAVATSAPLTFGTPEAMLDRIRGSSFESLPDIRDGLLSVFISDAAQVLIPRAWLGGEVCGWLEFSRLLAVFAFERRHWRR